MSYQLITVLIPFLFAILGFLIFRALVLWYWRVNEQIELLESIDEKLGRWSTKSRASERIVSSPTRLTAIAIGLPISIALYLSDCLLATYLGHHQDLPWLERGPIYGSSGVRNVFLDSRMDCVLFYREGGVKCPRRVQ